MGNKTFYWDGLTMIEKKNLSFLQTRPQGTCLRMVDLHALSTLMQWMWILLTLLQQYHHRQVSGKKKKNLNITKIP